MSDTRKKSAAKKPRRVVNSKTIGGRLTGAEATRALRAALKIVPSITTKIELWRADRLEILDRNPRTHSDEQVAQIAASLAEFGFLWPIMVNARAKKIVAGNGRFLAAIKLGLEVVPVVEESHLTPAQRRAFIIADNKIALNAGWSDEILADELPALRDAGIDLSVTGFSDEELAEILDEITDPGRGPTEPPIPKKPGKPTTRARDLWRLGSNRVLCGNPSSVPELMRLLENKKAGAVWTNPPPTDIVGADYLDAISGPLRATFDAMDKGAPIYVAHLEENGLALRQVFLESGFRFGACLIWFRKTIATGGDYRTAHEPILYGWKPGGSHRWFGDRGEVSIQEFDAPPFQQVGDSEWQIPIGDTTLIVRGDGVTIEAANVTTFEDRTGALDSDHPGMKPVALVQRMLSNSCRARCRVLDPFAGSGPTLIACEALGLPGYMMESDPRFVDVMVMRWQALTGRKATLADSGAPFDEVGNERPIEDE